jgi:NAD(P)H dehydrogenase (quinone)
MGIDRLIGYCNKRIVGWLVIVRKGVRGHPFNGGGEMAKFLVIYAHPNPHSFNHAILNQVETVLKRCGKEYIVRDLNMMPFHPVLNAADFISFNQGRVPQEILIEQEFIQKAETLIVIHPIWWFNMPGILKGYIDRVFARGFAYQVVDGAVKGLLADKKVMIFNTTGGSQENYAKFGYDTAVRTAIDQGVYGFCGMTVTLHKMLYAVPVIEQAQREAMLADIGDTVFE